jgi:hypothetical protein
VLCCPLILFRIWQVDQFEAEAKALEEKVRAACMVEEQNKKEQRRLIEVVTQAQIEMDGIKVSFGTCTAFTARFPLFIPGAQGALESSVSAPLVALG